MNRFNRLKLKAYGTQLLIGLLCLIIGIQILYSILSEMRDTYDVASRNAYVSGIIICCVLIIVGILFIIKAFLYEKQLYKSLTREEHESFLAELDEQTTLFFGTSLIVTKHYLVVKAKLRGEVLRLIRIENLIACFEKPYYASSEELVKYEIILCDKDFKLTVCEVKDKSVFMMAEAFRTICSLAPWVLSEDYIGFLGNYRKKSHQKAYLKMVDHRKEKTQIDEDTIPELLISAADLIQAFEAKTKATEKTNEKAPRKRKLRNPKKRK